MFQGLPSLLSVAGQESVTSMLNQLVPLIWHPESACDLAMSWAPGDEGLPSDTELITARTFDSENGRVSAGLVFHRTNLDSCFGLEVPEARKSASVRSDFVSGLFSYLFLD